MSTPTDLYRYFDKDDRLLYVGISFHAAARASQHKADKAWWPDAVRMTIESHPTREAAMAAELTAIRTEGPLHNIKGNGGKVTDVDVVAVKRSDDPLTGRFFLTPDPEKGWPLQQWQGHIIEALGAGLYLVQLYSWWDGRPTNQVMSALTDMTDWHFFSTEEGWREAGSEGMKARDRDIDRQIAAS